jgi:hypothetical protein
MIPALFVDGGWFVPPGWEGVCWAGPAKGVRSNSARGRVGQKLGRAWAACRDTRHSESLRTNFGSMGVAADDIIFEETQLIKSLTQFPGHVVGKPGIYFAVNWDTFIAA